MFSIGSVERDTGIGKDTLRIWERRYGFPIPQRNPKGERIYTDEQVKCLQAIKRLLDKGMRPGKIVGLSYAELDELIQSSHVKQQSSEVDEQLQPYIDCLVAHQGTQLNTLFEQALIQQGLNDFILNTVSPLLSIIGDRWAKGDLNVYEEHWFSRQLTQFLDIALSKLPINQSSPSIVLATLPNESHALALLMLEALLRNSDHYTINLGTEVPVEQLVLAVERYQPQALFLSFSDAYNSNTLKSDILDLANRLSDPIPIWIGGSGVKRMRKLPPNIIIENNLQAVLKFTTNN